MATATSSATESAWTILVRLLCNEDGQFPEEIARYILTLKFSDQDKARMHDLIVRNQNDELTSAEKDEMFAFGTAGDVLSILKSKARRKLGVKVETHPVP
jgi:hypothetical protein